MKTFNVGIIGATGMVGQRFATLLADHPWFHVTALAASPRSAGKTYKEAVEGRWAMQAPLPEKLADMVMLDASKVDEVASKVDFVFCAVDMKKDEIRALEEAYAKAECPVVSNNSAHRGTPDVPMIIPELNPEHAEIIPAQRKRLGTKRGFVAVKSNCSLQSYVPLLHPLKKFGIERAAVCTYQAISGAGKTFTMQLLALRMRMRGIQCYILAPLKGHEFKRACAAVGGTYIKISPGSTNCINVMEIRRTLSPEMELIDEMDYNSEDSLLSRKIQQLLIFFSLLIPDMSNEEEQMLDEALIKTYSQFGITHDNDSLYADKAHTRYKKMPILGDLHKLLEANPLTQRLAIIVSRFVTGSAQSFNQQTNVNLDNKYVVIDISELKGKLLPVGMFIGLDYVWDQVKSDRTKRKAIYIDEIWQLIGASSNRQAGEFCQEIFKIARGYGAAAIAASQDLSDFFSLEDGKYGRAIINNSKTKIILNLEPDEAEYVRETLKLTRTEIRSITQFERGEALISSNNNKVPVLVRASKVEQQLITTDRSELAAILKERQRAQKTQTEGNAFSEE